MTGAHEPEIHRYGNNWEVRCTCGYTVGPLDGQRTAEQARVGHLEQAVRVRARMMRR